MTHNLPEEFSAYTRQLMGDQLYDTLEHAIAQEDAPVSIRLNPFKLPQDAYAVKKENDVPVVSTLGKIPH